MLESLGFKETTMKSSERRKVRRMGLILAFVVGEVGQRRRSTGEYWLRRLCFWENGSVMAFPIEERLELKALVWFW